MIKICFTSRMYCYRKMDDALNAHLKAFVIDSNESLELRLVREIQDVDDEKTLFKPEMSHQVFGERLVH